MGLYAMAGCHCGQHLTDGFVDEYVVRELAGGAAPARRLAAALVAGQFWTPAEKEGNPGWQFTDWSDQPLREEVLARRAADKNRQKVMRDKPLRLALRRRDQDRCRYCAVRVQWTDRVSPAGGSYDHINPKGATSLENVVVCCRGCNRMKGKRTPRQAAMTLLPPPSTSSVLSTDQVPGAKYAEGDSADPYRSGRAGSGRVGSGQDGLDDDLDDAWSPDDFDLADLSGDG